MSCSNPTTVTHFTINNTFKVYDVYASVICLPDSDVANPYENDGIEKVEILRPPETSAPRTAPDPVGAFTSAPGHKLVSEGASTSAPGNTPVSKGASTLTPENPSVHREIFNSTPGRIFPSEGFIHSATGGHHASVDARTLVPNEQSVRKGAPAITMLPSALNTTNTQAPIIKPQYKIFQGSTTFCNTKCYRGIDGNIYALTHNIINDNTFMTTSNMTFPQCLHTFLPFMTFRLSPLNPPYNHI
jgi:hypothetical protein